MWAVRFEEVTKRYRKDVATYPSIRAELGRLRPAWTQRRRRQRPPDGTLALDRVSFQVDQGEAFALVGPNGAGKSTALRLLSGISPPTTGRVRGRGRVGALIEVGSGVHPELSGRENIWLYGSILGMSRRTIRQRFDEIVAFGELDEHIDTDVKFYSAGMQLRLGFAIAAHLEPEIFVVDEALAVGDVGFQDKCLARIHRLIREGTTVLFVSHYLPAIETLCNQAMLLDGGQPVCEGPVKDVLQSYLARMEHRPVDPSTLADNQGVVRLLAATIRDQTGAQTRRLGAHEPFEIHLEFASSRPLERPHVAVNITDGRPDAIVQCSMLDDGCAPARVGRRWECRLCIDALPLRSRAYQVDCAVYESTGHAKLMAWLPATTFRVEAPFGAGPRAVANSLLGAAVDVGYRWDVTTD